MKYMLQYKNGIVVVAILLVFGGIIKGLFSRYHNQMAALEEEEVNLKDKKSLLDKWRTASDEQAALEKGFFRGKDPLVYKRFLEEKIRDAGIALSYLSPMQREEEFFWEVTMKLKVDAPYINLAALMAELEDNNTCIDRISIRNTRDGRETDISLRSYIIKEE